MGLGIVISERMRSHKTRVNEALAAREEIAKLFERSPVQRPGSNERCWGQHFDWSPSQYGIYGTSSGIQVLVIARRNPDMPLLREARAVMESMEDPQSRFQLQRDHLNVYKLAFYVEAVRPGESGITASTPATRRLISAALPSGGWPDYRHDPAEEPDATVLATAVSLYALRRFDAFHGTAECDKGLRFLVGRQNDYALDHSLRGPTVVGYALLALHSYNGLPVAQRIDGYAEAVDRAERELTRWTKRRARRELFDQFRYDFVERPTSSSTRDSDFIALMPDCIAGIAFMQRPTRLNASRRRHVVRVVDEIVRGVKANGFKPRNVDKRATVDHLWAQRVLGQFLDQSVMLAFKRRNRAKSASRVSFWSRTTLLLALAGAATWASSVLVHSAVGIAAMVTFAAVTGGLAVEMLADRLLK